MTRLPAPMHPEAACDAVFASLRRVVRALDLHSRYLIQHHGLTGPQLLALRELIRAESCTVGRLARAIHLTQATLTGIIDRLERKGLVQRRRDPADRRRVVVKPTAAGRRMLGSTPSLLHDSFVRRFTQLSTREQTEILTSLQRLVAMLEPDADPGERVPGTSEPTGRA